MSSCSDFFNNVNTDAYDPLVTLEKKPSIIVDQDTFLFAVGSEDGLGGIVISLDGSENNYDFTINEKPYQLIISAEDYVSGDYGLNIQILNTNKDTVTSFCGTLSISNPDEETLVIYPFFAEEYEDVWVLLENSDRQILYCGEMVETGYFRIKLSEDIVPENYTYNLHFIFRNSGESMEVGSKVTVKSFFDFQGRLFAPLSYDTPPCSEWNQHFRFKNIPDYNNYSVCNPHLSVSSEIQKTFKGLFSTYENDVYVFGNKGDVYYAKLFQDLWKNDTILDIGAMDTVVEVNTITLSGTEPALDIYYLKKQNPLSPLIQIAKFAAIGDTAFTFPLLPVFTADPFFKTLVSFDPINGMDHKYIYYGQIPESIKIKDVEWWFNKDNKTTAIKTKYKFDYLTGHREFITTGNVKWYFITNEDAVTLPDFSEVIYESFPELKAFNENTYTRSSTCVNMITYSNFTHYYKLLENFDPYRFLPVDYESHNLFIFSKTINYE